MNQYLFFLGLDWGCKTHQLHLQGPDGAAPFQRAFEHGPRTLRAMMEWIERQIGGRWSQLAVGLERPHGPLVELFQGRGAAVLALNPKQMDRFRDRYSVAGAKSDPMDAMILCQTLQSDFALWRAVPPMSDRTVQVRQLAHALEQMEEQLRQQTNRLWDLLWRYFPALLELCGGADELWLWELLALASTPAQAARLSVKTLRSLLARYHIRRISAEQLQAVLKQPALEFSTGYEAAQVAHVQLLLPVLHVLHEQSRQALEQLQGLLEELDRPAAQAASQAPDTAHPPAAPSDLQIIGSIKGLGVRTVATLLGEADAALQARNYSQLRAVAGAAPVTKRSGTTTFVQRRLACNRRLRTALHHAANIARQHYPLYDSPRY